MMMRWRDRDLHESLVDVARDSAGKGRLQGTRHLSLDDTL